MWKTLHAFAPQTGQVLWWKPEAAVHGGVESGRIASGVRVTTASAKAQSCHPSTTPWWPR